jgi:hypothetical protein
MLQREDEALTAYSQSRYFIFIKIIVLSGEEDFEPAGEIRDGTIDDGLRHKIFRQFG